MRLGTLKIYIYNKIYLKVEHNKLTLSVKGADFGNKIYFAFCDFVLVYGTKSNKIISDSSI